jgi:hypothetical protein
MKILIITQYYPPEIGTPQNRRHKFAISFTLQQIEVEVLTAITNNLI